MLVFAFEMPPGATRGPVVVVLILEVENLLRMKCNDPFDLLVKQFAAAGIPLDRRLRDVDLVIAYEEDTAEIIGFRDRQDIAGLMRWLERGRKIRPGDLAKPERLKKQSTN